MNLPNSTVDDRVRESTTRPKQVDLNDIAAKIDELRAEMKADNKPRTALKGKK